jgi:hypothetical protein
MMKFAMTVLAIVLTAVSVLGQSQQQAPPTLKIVTEDAKLPSDVYYGNTKVNPLRVRPGTNRRLTVDDNDFFLQQHYIDFLRRMPDTISFKERLASLNGCATGNTSCDRITASTSFFKSNEFEGRGYFLYRLFVASFGRRPLYREFISNIHLITPVETAPQLAASKIAFTNNWVTRPAFKTKYDSLSAAAYVDELSAMAQVTLANRNALVSDLQARRKNRAQVLRAVIESAEINNKYYNEAFIVLGYYGYFRRDPDIGYSKLVTTLNTTGDYRAAINSFLSSPMYRSRF